MITGNDRGPINDTRQGMSALDCFFLGGIADAAANQGSARSRRCVNLNASRGLCAQISLLIRIGSRAPDEAPSVAWGGILHVFTRRGHLCPGDAILSKACLAVRHAFRRSKCADGPFLKLAREKLQAYTKRIFLATTPHAFLNRERLEHVNGLSQSTGKPCHYERWRVRPLDSRA